MGIRDFKELIVWQKSMDLVVMVYEITALLPAKERYGLESQLRRAAVSIPSNIAEGQKRNSTKELLQFLRIALGSAAELETQLLLLKRLYGEYNIATAQQLLMEIQKMLSRLIKTLGAQH